MSTKFTYNHNTSNSKIGKNKGIGTVMITADSCPDTCKLKGQGCYAETGWVGIHWRRLNANVTGTDWVGLNDQVKARPPKSGLVRFGVAGDLPQHGQTGEINGNLVGLLQGIFKGLKVYGYTHHRQSPHNLQIIQEMAANGWYVNFSCDSLQDAVDTVKRGYPAVTVVSENETRQRWYVDGVPVVVCPAQTRDGMDCATCRLCMGPRKCVVAFRAHGAKRKSVTRRLESVL